MTTTECQHYYDKGWEEYQAGRLEDAVDNIERAVQSCPDEARFRLTLGALYVELGRLEDAERCLRGVFNIDYENNAALVWLGYLSSLKGDLDQSIYYYSRALEIVENAYVRGNLGAVYQRLGWYREALVQYGEAVSQDSSLSWVWQNMGGVFLDLSRFEDAEETFRKAIELEPEEWASYQRLGDALMGLGRREEARKYYEEAFDKTRDEYGRADTLGSMALFFETNEEFAEAIDVREKQRKILRDVEDIEGQVESEWELGWDYYRCGRYEEAIDVNREALGKMPDLVPVRFNLGLALLRLSRKDEALREYETAIQHLENLSDLEKHGIADLREAIEHSPTLDGAKELLNRLEQEKQRREPWLHTRAT